MGEMSGAGLAGLDEGNSLQQDAASVPCASNAPNAPIDRALHRLGNLDNALNNLDGRADPDAQATVTDFLDFTEYLPADMTRSLTLIGKLDKTYIDASVKVHDLTVKWGQLPNMAPEERLSPVQLRAQISEKLVQAVSSRVYSHMEAVRMSDNIKQHHKRVKTIFTKLQVLLENYPMAEQEIAANKYPQATRNTKLALGDSSKAGRQRFPRITVPGEVLAPYDLNYDTISSEGDDDSSAEEEMEKSLSVRRITPGPQARIKVIKGLAVGKPLKTGRAPKPKSLGPIPPLPPGGLSTGAALLKLKPPPDDAEIGGPDAPWCQLTVWELAILRKRMKKNANWVPSETMVARELLEKKRSMEHYKEAKNKAEEAGLQFEGKLPEPVPWGDGVKRMPPGALNPHSRIPDERLVANRGIALNELKRQKKLLEKLGAEDAKNSESRFSQLVKEAMNPLQAVVPQPTPVATSSSKAQKRKRPQSVPRGEEQKAEVADMQELQRPPVKRPKTETPVPPPLLTTNPSPVVGKNSQRPVLSANMPQTTTPIPLPMPVHGQEVSMTAKSSRSVASAVSPFSNSEGLYLDKPGTISVLPKQATETPIPPPVQLSRKPTTPLEPPSRETRKSHARRQEQQRESQAALTNKAASQPESPEPLTLKPDPDDVPTVSCGAAASVVGGSTAVARRPASRGQGSSMETQASLAVDRPRRASTARNTPAPESVQRPVGKRPKRPVPGVITRTHSGGSSAIGRRKAAPKKGRRKPGKDKGALGALGASVDAVGGGLEVEVEVDDEGNVIDPDEARYCTCNRVSFGTMIQCDNVDNCKCEWFHLECVGLTEILPARTTKWYCPDCRVLLKLGERGEVSARGVKA